MKIVFKIILTWSLATQLAALPSAHAAESPPPAVSTAAASPAGPAADAQPVATPPADPKDELVLPFSLLGGALLLLIGMIVSRRTKGDGGSGGGEQKSG